MDRPPNASVWDHAMRRAIPFARSPNSNTYEHMNIASEEIVIERQPRAREARGRNSQGASLCTRVHAVQLYAHDS